ncbi:MULTISPECIES: hypothetical protein [Shouchella]|uniref:Uncharacterized protein n=3 Tax=Bacillaceae TaxID=186817 RepID=A0A060M3K7_9BACI|nr:MULTISPECIES: hypothetical protein [Bacillaceae]RQW20948.1 hypothetical protein EH196_12845 [Bacillus sp. C1-1]AIC95128.1 hypothetical protein BleG1_2561 [Shouchella lehensis G1]KQL57629.1 hypothetical protein AN965_09050 [Alkalicoccobacillus plakortidis]MBG9784053.1 hypothetical protein [Shouchella lehensis]TES50971.1 hypothetical protein E2L03_03360 [Shouchella lehensis]
MSAIPWPTEFQELSIKITKRTLHQFIKNMMANEYALYWRYDSSFIYLIIELEDLVHELPFIRNEQFLTLKAKKLYIYDSILSDVIEELLQSEKGTGVVKRMTEGPQYVTTYEHGDIASTVEIEGSEQGMANKNVPMIQYKENGKSLGPKTMINVMNLEINYILMELFEAMEENNEEAIAEHKHRLKKLVNRRSQVEKLLKL